SSSRLVRIPWNTSWQDERPAAPTGAGPGSPRIRKDRVCPDCIPSVADEWASGRRSVRLATHSPARGLNPRRLARSFPLPAVIGNHELLGLESLQEVLHLAGYHRGVDEVVIEQPRLDRVDVETLHQQIPQASARLIQLQHPVRR